MADVEIVNKIMKMISKPEKKQALKLYGDITCFMKEERKEFFKILK